VLTIAFCTVATTTPGWADLPLMVEDLITPEKSLRLELGVSYTNLNRDYGYERHNRDGLFSQLGIRYGVLPGTELYGKLMGGGSQLRRRVLDTTSNSGWQLRGHSVKLGINRRFSPDTDTPALLGFLEVLAVENVSESGAPKIVHAKTWRAGLTTYRSIDPVVLSLTAGYRYAGPRRIPEQGTVDPSDHLFLAPSLSFAINDAISVSGGLAFSLQGKSTEAGSLPMTQTGLTLGISHAISQRLTMHTAVYTDISGGGGSQVNAHFTYDLME